MDAEDDEGVLSPWTPSTIRVDVALENGTKQSVRTDCECMGPIAVHGGIADNSGLYNVTHRPTGLRLAFASTLEDAKRIGEVLNNRCTLALSKRNGEDILDAMPGWAVEWMKRCVAARKYLEPQV